MLKVTFLLAEPEIWNPKQNSNVSSVAFVYAVAQYLEVVYTHTFPFEREG